MLPTTWPAGIVAFVTFRVQLTVVGIGWGDLKAVGGGAFGTGAARSASPLARFDSWSCQSKRAALPVTRSNKTGINEALRLCSFEWPCLDSAPPAQAVGAVETFDPDRINFGSPERGACGATILWKQVGHSNGFPLALESAVICCPHTGQANLNSLICRINNSISRAERQCKNSPFSAGRARLPPSPDQFFSRAACSSRASFRFFACIGTMNDECAQMLLPLLGGEGRAFAAPKRLRPRRRGEGGITVHGSWRASFLFRACIGTMNLKRIRGWKSTSAFYGSWKANYLNVRARQEPRPTGQVWGRVSSFAVTFHRFPAHSAAV